MFHPESLPLPVRWFLRLLSLPYGLVVRFRNFAFDRGWKQSIRVDVPVVSIGNLTLGGTGKTPCVEYVADFLRQRGHQVCLLSRGYRASSSGSNDEAMLLEENLPDVPHLQNPNRIESAKIAIDELEAEILILDDGFQHRRLKRDLDLVLIDVNHPPHRDWLFPGGTLREPISSLKRAHAVILTHSDSVPESELNALTTVLSHWIPPTACVVRSIHKPIELIRVDADPLDPVTLRGRTLGMVSGIGNPAAFRRTLESLGATIAAEKQFPDHHGYTRADVEGLEAWARQLPEDAWIAITQKDHVKLRIPALAGRPVVAVRIGLTFTKGEAELQRLLEEGIRKSPQDPYLP
ncbi:MAG: tetraacyldisaccharide 4'-kinase [Gemmataceae bacterium]